MEDLDQPVNILLRCALQPDLPVNANRSAPAASFQKGRLLELVVATMKPARWLGAPWRNVVAMIAGRVASFPPGSLVVSRVKIRRGSDDRLDNFIRLSSQHLKAVAAKKLNRFILDESVASNRRRTYLYIGDHRVRLPSFAMGTVVQFLVRRMWWRKSATPPQYL
jgi:hypothetical protein